MEQERKVEFSFRAFLNYPDNLSSGHTVICSLFHYFTSDLIQLFYELLLIVKTCTDSAPKIKDLSLMLMSRILLEHLRTQQKTSIGDDFISDV